MGESRESRGARRVGRMIEQDGDGGKAQGHRSGRMWKDHGLLGFEISAVASGVMSLSCSTASVGGPR